MIKAIIFDIGGVFASQKTFNRAYDKAIEKYFGITPQDPAYKTSWTLFPEIEVGKISQNEFWRKFAEAHQKPYRTEELYIFFEQVARKIKMRKSMYEVAEILKRNGITIAALSNSVKETVDILAKRKFYDVFDYTFLSNEVRLRKPDKEIFQLAIQTMHIEPSQAIFVDDWLPNVEAAEKIGLHGIHFKTFPRFIRELRSFDIHL